MIAELLAFAIIMADGGKVPLPPVQYHGDNYVRMMQTVSNPDMMQIMCGSEPGDTILACAYGRKRQIYIPNPCLHKEESYARLLCHEMGHINGWSGDHPDSDRN